HPRRRAGRAEPDHHFKETGELPEGIQWIPRRKNCPLRQTRSTAAARQHRDRAQSTEDRGHNRKRESVPRLREEMESFDTYLWSFVGGKPIQNRWRNMADVPARTAESDAMSRDLLQRGFKFVGSTICYALMQATGMVNDHLVTCPRHAELGGTHRRK